MNKGKKATVGTRKTTGSVRTSGPNGAGRNGSGNGSAIKSFKRTGELEAAIQRYSDLYEFAPVGYITFDRTGRIEEVNLAACELLGTRRESLIGAPFSLWVALEDLSLLLGHLVRCRAGERRVETNLRLKKGRNDAASVLLSSTPASGVFRDGSQFFQTAIVDLTERERAEQALRAKEE